MLRDNNSTAKLLYWWRLVEKGSRIGVLDFLEIEEENTEKDILDLHLYKVRAKARKWKVDFVEVKDYYVAGKS